MWFRLIAAGTVVLGAFISSDRPSIAARALNLAVLGFMVYAFWRIPDAIEIEKIRARQIAQLRHVSKCPLCGRVADDPAAEKSCDGVAHFNSVNRRMLERA